MGRTVPPRASDSQRSGSRRTVHQTGEARMFAMVEAVLAGCVFHVVGRLVEFVQLVLVEIEILIVVVVVIVIRAVY